MTETKKKTEKKKYTLLSNVLYFHRYLYREYPRVAAYHAVSIIGEILLPVFGILMPGIVLRAVEGGGLLRGLGYIGLAGIGILLCNGMVSDISTRVQFWHNTFREVLLSDVVLKEMKCLYRYVEYGEEKRAIKRVHQSLAGGGSISHNMFLLPHGLVADAACFFLYSTVLGTLEPWLAVFLLLFAVVSYGINHLMNRWVLASREGFAQSEREIQYLNQTLRDNEAAKDIRLFAMGGWLADFRGKVFRERLRMERKVNHKSFWAYILQLMLSLARNGIAYAYLIHACLQGDITVAGFLVYFGAITGFSGFVMGIGEQYSALKLANADAVYFRFVMDLPEALEEGEAPVELYRKPAGIEFRDVSFSYDEAVYSGQYAGKRKGDAPDFHIEFRHVSFRYPGSESYALKDFSLKFRVGEHMAIVGMNSSGKTTMIKLMCRLYDPQEGEILLNGVDIRKFKREEYLHLFSVVFQDFKLLALPLGENVAASSRVDTDRAAEVLRQAGLGERLDRLPGGLDTYLYQNIRDDGVEISGGEAQKIAIARALYKDAPFVLLDEPTASLDPLSEYEIYSRFDSMVKDKTAVYISHCLSSCRFCDDIAVFHEGRLVQRGSHEELLLDEQGKYYELWHAQAQYYTEK
jgi:ATP-binding cassette subfamily B protein